MKAKVLKTFNDLRAKIRRTPGSVFEITQTRFEEICAKLPGYIEEDIEAVEECPTMANTAAEIKAYAGAKGIDLQGATKKAEMLEVISAVKE